MTEKDIDIFCAHESMARPYAFILLRVVCSIKKISGQVKRDEKLYPENFTQILDQLLEGYDSRLRPGFGGMYHK